MPQLSQRDLQPELMDDPHLNTVDHQAALEGLRRINRWSRSAAIVWPTLRELSREHTSDRPLRVLDIACGGGDVTQEIARRARRTNRPIVVAGCDKNPFAVKFSSEAQSGSQTVPLRIFPLDALRDELPRDFDVLMCSLFLHHLPDEEAGRFLSRLAKAARRLVLINDLRRTRLGYALAYAGCRLLTRSPIVHYDGPQSVRAAFTSEEVRALAQAAGLTDAHMTHHWPQRFLLSWRKPA